MPSLNRIVAAAFLAAALAFAAAGPGFADSKRSVSVPASERLNVGRDASAADIRDRLAEQGFDVRKVEFEGYKTEVKVYDASGRCLEIYFDPASGEEIRRKRDDDCGRRLSLREDWYGDRLIAASDDRRRD
jgi:hypothetical protein